MRETGAVTVSAGNAVSLQPNDFHTIELLGDEPGLHLHLYGRSLEHLPNRLSFETSRVAYNPAHRWYYFSEMQTDEALLIRIHDSAIDGRARLSFHTSFENPLMPDAPPRESIEVRALVFFPPAS